MRNENSPQIERAKRTLEVIAETLDNAKVKYAVFGRFAKTILETNKGRKFDKKSDLDIAVYEDDLERAKYLLSRSYLSDEIIKRYCYNSREKPYPSYIFNKKDCIDIHISGSLPKEMTEEHRVINGITYFAHHISFGRRE